jgi:hypothetical protein
MNSINVTWHGRKIGSWAQFHKHVKPGRKLLAQLEVFPDPVFVAGCQRSGTTAVARMLYRADGVGRYRFGKDDELDAALLLSGYAEVPITGRGVFQTTYLNDRVSEYFEHDRFRLIWILREPRAVVYSMLFNWRRGALRRLYEACGREPREERPAGFFGRDADLFRSRLDKACAAYSAKTQQTFELIERLGSDRLLVVDYNELVLNKEALMPEIFEFAGLEFRDEFLESLHAGSLSRARWEGDKAERIDRLCRPVYERARAAAGYAVG